MTLTFPSETERFGEQGLNQRVDGLLTWTQLIDQLHLPKGFHLYDLSGLHYLEMSSFNEHIKDHC